MHQEKYRKEEEGSNGNICENINKTCDKVKCHELKYNFPTFYRYKFEYKKCEAL